MKLIIVLALLQLAFCGHIYVSDPQLFYQNKDYITSAQLYFKLETELQVGEVLKITWPYKFNYTSGSVVAKINKAGSTATPKALTTIAATDLEYLIAMSEKLDALQWYTLNLSTATPQSPPAQYYSTPIKMSTHSGCNETSVDKYALYDYNNMCGFIAVASTPVKMKSVSVSTSATSIILPGQADGSKDYEDSYYVYITIKTLNDYDYGGIYYLSLIGGFTWQGDCTYFSQTCGVDETTCTPVKALTTKEYSCEALVGASQMKFARFQNSTKYAINKEEPLKLKVKVKNPSRKDVSPISVQLVSHYANFIYEYYSDSTTIFQTNLIVLNLNDTLYFWRLPYEEAADAGCPVRFYTSVVTGIAVWNKIWLPFAPNKTLPSSAAGFRLRAQIKPATWINDVSIYTDAPSFNFNSAPIHCYSVKATDSYIECLNLGVLQVNVTKYLRFSFMMTNSDYTAADAATLARFGEISIFFMDSDDKVTETRVPSKIPTTSFLSQTYYKENALLTKASDATIAELLNPDDTAYRTSIIYSAKLDLVFLITTTYALQCTGTTCDTGKAPPSIIVKIIANPNAIKLSILDSSVSTALDVYKGVEVLQGIKYTDSEPKEVFLPGTFGATYHATTLCHYIKDPTDKAICSTNSGDYYINYTDASSSTTGKQYLYNQWFKHDNKYELHLVCYSNGLTADICGGYVNTQQLKADPIPALSRGIVMKDVEFLLQANPLYPSQNELDFIMCIRYTASTTFKYTEATSLASSSLINAQIINLRSKIGTDDTSTFFKIGVLNYYANTDSNYNYVPTILRVGGYMQAADIKDNQGIAFFFDGANIVINSQTLSDDFPLLPRECSSIIATDSPICQYYPKTLMTATTITSNHLDYYPGLNVITISGRIAEKVEFNYYIPVQIKASAFTTAFIGLLSNVQAPQPSIVFKLYGSQESKLTVNFAPASTDQLTAAGLLAAATDGSTSLTTGNDWESTTATNYGKINAEDANVFTKADSIVFSGLPIQPESNATSPSIDASQTGTWDDPFNDETGSTGLASKMQFAGSVHFTVHSSIKFWSSPFTWSLTNKTKKPFSGACAEMTITSWYSSTVNATSYLIVCPYEGTLKTGDNAKKTGLKIDGFSSWKWPDYFGKDAPIGAYLRYLWTDQLGNLKAFIAEKQTGSAIGCNEPSEAYALNTNQAKTTFSITPLSSLVLLKSPLDKSKMEIKLTTTVSTTNEPATSKCSVELENVKCELTKSDKIYTFTLTNINTENPVTIQKTAIQINFWYHFYYLNFIKG